MRKKLLLPDAPGAPLRKLTVLGTTLGLVALLLAGCSQPTVTQALAPQSPTAPQASAAAAEPTGTWVETKAADLLSTWGDDATTITLQAGGIAVTGAGAQVDGKLVTITAAGTYVVRGTLADGQIAIAATKDDKVHLVLNGVNLTNLSGAAIYASQCDKLILTLADGSENSVTDGGSAFVYANETDEEPNAAIFSKDDLTINGLGALTVNAGFHNGIGTKDDLLIVSGAISVNAANHGVRGNDSVAVLDGVLTIISGNDGIQTEGDLAIAGGQMTLTVADDAIHADANLSVSGGTLAILQSYEGLEAANIGISGGTITVISSDDGLNAAGGTDASGRDSFAAGNYAINISGGNISVQAGGDGLDSNGSITISGGNLVSLINSRGNGAVDANGAITYTGGTIIYGGSDAGSLPGGNSTQSYISVNANIPAGSEISVKKGGETLAAFTATLACSSLVVSTPALVSGESYEVYNGTALVTTATAGTGTGTGSGMMGPGGGRGGQRPQGQSGAERPDNGGQMPGNRPADGQIPGDWSTPSAEGQRPGNGGQALPPTDSL